MGNLMDEEVTNARLEMQAARIAELEKQNRNYLQVIHKQGDIMKKMRRCENCAGFDEEEAEFKLENCDACFKYSEWRLKE